MRYQANPLRIPFEVTFAVKDVIKVWGPASIVYRESYGNKNQFQYFAQPRNSRTSIVSFPASDKNGSSCVQARSDGSALTEAFKINLSKSKSGSWIYTEEGLR